MAVRRWRAVVVSVVVMSGAVTRARGPPRRPSLPCSSCQCQPDAPSTRRTGWSAPSTTWRRRPGWRCCGPAGRPPMPRSPPAPCSPSRPSTCAAWAATCSRSCTTVRARRRRSPPSGRAGSGADAAALRAEGHRAIPSVRRRARRHRAGLRRRLARAARALRARAARRRARPGRGVRARRASRRRRCWRGARRSSPASTGADDYRTDGGLRAGDRVRRPLGRARSWRAVAVGGPGRVLRRRVRRRPPRARRRPVHGRRPGGAARRVGRAAPPHRVGPRGVDGAAAVAGLPHAWPPRGSPTASTSPTDPDDAGLGAPARRGGPPGGLRPARRCCTSTPTATPCSHPDRLAPAARRHRPRPTAARSAAPSTAGDTIYLCAVDGDGMGVSLIQSNAAGWGCHLVVPGTGVFLHNRGIGFSLEAGHPAELAPGPRPPHTLAPALVTRDGALHAVLGTMGGDIAAAGRAAAPRPAAPRRPVTRHGRPVAAMGARRRRLRRVGATTTRRPRSSGTRRRPGRTGLADRGPPRASGRRATANFGHAHVIVRAPDGMLAGAADPRALSGAAIGW